MSVASAIGIGIAALFSFPYASPVGAQDNSLADGLIGYWQFEDNLTDSFGSANGIGWPDERLMYGNGKFGRGVVLDGVEQFVVIDPDTEGNFDLPDDRGMTISAWFSADTLESFEEFLGRRLLTKASPGVGGPYISGVESGVTLRGGTGRDFTFAQTSDIEDGEIHHVVVVGKSGQTRVFIDGKLDTTTDHRQQHRENYDSPLVIGGEASVFRPEFGGETQIFPGGGPLDISWHGMIDDVAIWKRGLRDDEIAALWNDGEGLEVSKRIDFGLARTAGFVPTPNGLKYRFRNGMRSTVDPESIVLTFNDEIVNFDLESEGDLVTATFVADRAPAGGLWATYSIVARDSLGNSLEDRNRYPVPRTALPVAGEEFAGPPGQAGAWGLLQIDRGGNGLRFSSLEEAMSILRYAEQPDFNGNKYTDFSPTVNFSNASGLDAGLFPDDSALPADELTDEDFVIVAKGAFEHSGGPLTIGVHSNEGFALRLRGASFDRVAGNGALDTAFKNTLFLPDSSENGDTRGMIENLDPGTYGLEFIAWNGDREENGEPIDYFFEVYSAPGVFPEDDDTDEWKLVGDPDGLPLVTLGEVAVPAVSQLVANFDGVSFQITDVPLVMLDPDTIRFTIGGVIVDSQIQKSGSTTSISYVPPTPLPPGFSALWVLTYRDQEGAERSLQGRIRLPAPPFPSTGPDGPEGTAGNWGIREIRNLAFVNSTEAIQRALSPGDDATVVDSAVPQLNFSQPRDTDDQGSRIDPPAIIDAGLFGDDIALPATPDEFDRFANFVVVSQAFVEVPENGDYTLGVLGGGGFWIRFKGHPLTPFNLDIPDPNPSLFPEYWSEPSAPRGVNLYRYLRDLKAGIYEIEFIASNTFGDIKSLELFSGPGIVPPQEPSEDFALVGGEGGWKLVSDPESEFQILSIQRDESDAASVELTFESEPGASYRIFNSIDLQTFSEIADGVSSQGLTTTFRDTLAQGRTLYYRVAID